MAHVLEAIADEPRRRNAPAPGDLPGKFDYWSEDQVAALFEQVGRERNRLDVLAIVMTGQPASWKSFLDEAPAEGKTFVDGWIWPHVGTAWHGVKLMTHHRAGLIVELVEQDTSRGNCGAGAARGRKAVARGPRGAVFTLVRSSSVA